MGSDYYSQNVFCQDNSSGVYSIISGIHYHHFGLKELLFPIIVKFADLRIIVFTLSAVALTNIFEEYHDFIYFGVSIYHFLQNIDRQEVAIIIYTDFLIGCRQYAKNCDFL